MKRAFICIALGCTLFLNAWAGMNEGLAAYKKKNYAVAVREFMNEAVDGNPAAQFHLGEMYKNGLGVERNYKLAFDWYQKAAERGYADAQYSQGLMYEEGNGINRDLEVAAHWYGEAVKQGHKAAAKRLAILKLNAPTPASPVPQESDSDKIARDYRDGKIVCKNLGFKSRFDRPTQEFTFAWMWANGCDWVK